MAHGGWDGMAHGDEVACGYIMACSVGSREVMAHGDVIAH
jgi:hypothetical protein